MSGEIDTLPGKLLGPNEHINNAKLQQILTGLQARIATDAVTDRELEGEIVDKINQPRSVATVSALASLTVPPDFLTQPFSVQVQGYYAPGDGGGGSFILTEDSGLTANGGTIFAATAVGADWFWVRDYSGPVNILWAGAIADGETCAAEACEICAAVGDSVFIPHTEHGFAFKRAAVIPSDTTVYGVGRESRVKASPDGDYLGVFDVSGSANVCIHDLYGQGKGGDAIPVVGGGSEGGAFVRGGNALNITVRNCYFDDFKLAGSIDSGVIHLYNSAFLQITGNHWLRGNEGGTDISLAYRVGNTTITGNHSVSGSDKFAYISSVGSGDKISEDSEISKTSHHIISNNIYLKWEGKGGPKSGRHGIVCHYQGGRTHAIITGNIIANGRRHGIYLRGADSNQVTGPSIVSNNIIRYFGGGETSSTEDPTGYNNGIQIESTDGCLIQGNLIDHIGYAPDGTKREMAAAGMGMARQSRNITISCNFISYCTGGGIVVFPTVSSRDSNPWNVDKMSIEGNHLWEIEKNMINVFLPSDSVIMNQLRIVDNVLTASEAGQMMIATRFRNEFPKMTRVSGNILQGTGADQGQVGVGLPHNSAVGALLVVENNDFRDVEMCGRVSTGGSALGWIGGFHLQRKIGYDTVFNGNRAFDCGNLIYSSNTSTGRLLVIDPSNLAYGTTPEPQRVISVSNRGVYGRVIGKNGAGEALFEYFADSVPTVGQFYKGDRIKHFEPSSGGFMGRVCVQTSDPSVSGDPGIWKGYGAIEV
jgi:parallel beta-helix repeat protein